MSNLESKDKEPLFDSLEKWEPVGAKMGAKMQSGCKDAKGCAKMGAKMQRWVQRCKGV